MEGRVNVKDVIENPESYRGLIPVPVKVNPLSAAERLQMVSKMAADVEKAVSNAEIGVSPYWRDSYDNLYDALQICKNIEKSYI